MHTTGKGFMNTHRLSPLPGFSLRRVAITASALAGISVLSVGATGCIQDTDCGICDPDNLILESISGINYASDKVHILSPECEGDNCPAPFTKGSYFLDDLIPCEETEDAQDSPNAAEYCKLSPLVTAFGIEFVFNNLLDPTSIELVRKRPDNPQLFEVYDWKTDVLEVRGPITRFNGDYARGQGDAPDTITRLVNLSCIDNLADNGDFDPGQNPCDRINPTTGLPMRLRFEDFDELGNAVSPTIKAARGIWTANSNSCSSPEEGPDTCCTYCDYLLSTKIDRYGVDPNGVRRNPNPGVTVGGEVGEGEGEFPYAPAIQCGGPDEAGTVIDKFDACRDFIVSVDRSNEEQSWRYKFCDPADSACQSSEPEVFDLPLFDKLRETHPDQRPANLESFDAKCTATSQCIDVHGLSGTECVGTTSNGNACLADAYDDDTCQDAVCRPQWMVTCRYDDTTTGGGVAYCQDRRFATSGTAACHFATTNNGVRDCDVEGGGCVTRGRPEAEDAPAALAFADWDENGRVEADEACQESLGPGDAPVNDEDGVIQCDPYYQANLFKAPRYQRDENLPAPSRGCVCPIPDQPEPGASELGLDPDESSTMELLDSAPELLVTADGYAEYVKGTPLEACIDSVQTGCYDDQDNLIEGRQGEYAVKFVSRFGGIVYDPAIKGFDWRPADIGGVPRADIENCAENNTDRLVAPLNRHDGWRAADTFTPENFENFDRAMCSGQEYTVVFNEPGDDDNPAYVIDKADNTLAGKSVYTFETAQFHVQPGSGFPTDNLRIGACDEFSLNFSNKYDSSPENLAKLQLYRVSCTGTGADKVCEPTSPDSACDSANPPPGACCETSPVAGGSACYETQPELKAAIDAGNTCAAPCMTIDIEDQFIGKVKVQVDPIEFGQFLEVSQSYQLLAPTAGTVEDAFGNDDLYKAVFWDACGMPLVAQNAEPYAYNFTIDTPKCAEDKDKDGVPLSCDNDRDRLFNPDQTDIDSDGFGADDLCPVVAGPNDDSADSDTDGVGNACDNCRQTLTQYNANAVDAAIPEYMMVRNIPDQTDTDNDGIGDVCDNCITVPNCEDFGPDRPHEVDEAIAFDNDDLCQTDADGSMIGDLCEGGDPGENAAGVVGFEDSDDFDQDGLINAFDGCPRQPLPGPPVTCTPETAEADCGPDVPCALSGVCNHLDSDGDGVGNACDTCAFQPNPSQAMDGGSQDDDPDGDFVGEVCEVGADKGCGNRNNARPFGFFGVSALGNCCTTQLIEADEAAAMASADRGGTMQVGDLLIAATCPLATEGNPVDLSRCTPLTANPFDGSGNLFRDEEGNPILNVPVRTAANCTEDMEDQNICRALPTDVETTPGILTPPPGCEMALEAAGVTALDNLLNPLDDGNFSDQPNPLDALWQTMCFLPQRDQDYDGIGDRCEYNRCEFAFDPTGAPFVDPNGRLWSDAGAACNGELAADNVCELEEQLNGESGDTEGVGGSSSGGDEGGSTGG